MKWGESSVVFRIYITSHLEIVRDIFLKKGIQTRKIYLLSPDSPADKQHEEEFRLMHVYKRAS
jgi:hypothetical protein